MKWNDSFEECIDCVNHVVIDTIVSNHRKQGTSVHQNVGIDQVRDKTFDDVKVIQSTITSTPTLDCRQLVGSLINIGHHIQLNAMLIHQSLIGISKPGLAVMISV